MQVHAKRAAIDLRGALLYLLKLRASSPSRPTAISSAIMACIAAGDAA